MINPEKTKKHQIVVCMGSSCFRKGNKYLFREVEAFVKRHQLDEQVSINSIHCFDKCDEGPIVKVNGEYHKYTNAKNLEELLRSRLIGG
ncbi:MAG: NAD(P)H-dependent oxidoreductase subunit E [Bacteroidota bacterium]